VHPVTTWWQSDDEWLETAESDRALRYIRRMELVPQRCDLHVHSLYSTDSGNYALRRARLGESYTEPRRVYESCIRRGMTLVTISDHNTLEGALRIADRPGTFLSEEVTTRFPDDDVPLHVLVWNLTEEDHRDLQEYRPSVFALVDFLISRGLAHALAHPLYRMGPPLTMAHVEQMMLLFRVWEVQNGARPERSNVIAGAFRESCTPAYLETLAARHGTDPRHSGPIGICAGSDDHGAIDIATTWTEATGDVPAEFLTSVAQNRATVHGEHGSSVKLAHSIGALLLHSYRSSGRIVPQLLSDEVTAHFDAPLDGRDRHDRIIEATASVAKRLAADARSGALDLDQLPSLGSRLGALMLAGTIEAPFVAAVRHQAQTRLDLRELEAEFFGLQRPLGEPRAFVFTDTFDETNGVAGTMRRLASAGAESLPLTVVTCGEPRRDNGLAVFAPDWSVPLPAYESLTLSVPSFTEVLAYVERELPDVVHVATPGPVGLCGLAVAKALSLPLVGSFHTEFGPYALRLTRDVLVSEALDRYVEWFYKQCALVLGPTQAVASALEAKGLAGRTGVWGRGVDATLFTPARRDEDLRDTLLGTREFLTLYVGRLSHEKSVDVLLRVAAELQHDSVSVVVAGDGPAREVLDREAPDNVVFAGELHDEELARVYASADVFCFPSTTDTFGQVILEAAASGLPIVAAGAGGALELVRPGETGVLVTPGAAAEFAESIRQLIRAPERRAVLAAAARSDALRRTWDASIEELRGAYRVVAGEPARVSALAPA
jgi:glycosyltransferase involved in cell wall biosynthesis